MTRPAYKNETTARAILASMDPAEYGDLRDAYYKAAEGIAALADALQGSGFGREHSDAKELRRLFEDSFGNLSAGL